MRASALVIVLSSSIALSSSPALAQDVRDADVLPRGVGVFLLGSGFTFGLDRFGPAPALERESILTDFDQLDLTQLIAGPDAPLVETFIGSLGTTNFDADQQSFFLDFTIGYGITDRLTVAARMPFQYSQYTVDAWLSPKENQAQWRVAGETFECPGGNFDVANVEDLQDLLIEAPGYRFSIADLNRALVSPCLGYVSPFDRIDRDPSDNLQHGYSERTYSGFRDLALAAKYKLYHGRNLGLSGLLWVVAPTGAVDDPDDFFDPRFGDGNWDVALVAAATIPLDRFRATVAAGYEVQLPDSILLRLWDISFSEELEDQLASGAIDESELFDEHLDDGQTIPVVPAYEKAIVDRKLGDNIYVYTGLGYEITEWLSASILIDYLYHFRDAITDTGAHVEDGTRYPTEEEVRAAVETEIERGELDEADRDAELKARLGATAGRKAAAYAWHTVRQQLVLGVGVSVSTLSAFTRGDFPFPFIASLGASVFLFGQNIDTDDAFSLSIALPFAFSDVKDPAEYGYDDEGGGLPWP